MRGPLFGPAADRLKRHQSETGQDSVYRTGTGAAVLEMASLDGGIFLVIAEQALRKWAGRRSFWQRTENDGSTRGQLVVGRSTRRHGPPSRFGALLGGRR